MNRQVNIKWIDWGKIKLSVLDRCFLLPLNEAVLFEQIKEEVEKQFSSTDIRLSAIKEHLPDGEWTDSDLEEIIIAIQKTCLQHKGYKMDKKRFDQLAGAAERIAKTEDQIHYKAMVTDLYPDAQAVLSEMFNVWYIITVPVKLANGNMGREQLGSGATEQEAWKSASEQLQYQHKAK